MKRRQLVLLALAGEGLLVVIAVVWAHVRGIAFVWGDVTQAVWAGAAATLVLAAANWYLLLRAPDVGGVGSIRRIYSENLKPMFAETTMTDVVVISLMAGVGEELLFRGVLQVEVGLVPASLVFGLLHTGGAGTLAFGGWVAVMGLALGSLAVWTDGLLAPIIAHSAYDAAAMSYIRWDARHA